jgi:hypothetical protein
MTDNFGIRAVVCVGIAIVLIGDGLILATHDGDPGTTTAESVAADDSSSSDTSASDGAASSDLSPIVPELEAFVETARGLKFKEPVPVDFLSSKAFTAKLRDGGGSDDDDDDEEGPADQAAFEGFLRALGLVHGSIDLGAAAAAVEEDGIVGFYDPEEKRLYVRGVEPTPFVRQVLVHELTHALDDQHFDLDRPELDDRNDESSESFRALVEGSAVAVEAKYVASLSDAEQQDAADEENSAGSSAAADIPEIVGQLLSYPYAVGPGLVEALVDAGGEARLEEALANPPVTSEQTLHPEKFLSGEGAASVPKPVADGKIFDRGVLGEVVLLLMLQDVLPRPVARKAAAGWGGDQYVAWAKGDKTCVRWSMVMDTPTDTAELVSALRKWEESNVGASVQAGETVTVTNCG